MAPITQRALLLPAPKAQWTVDEVPVPTPGPKDVLVKIITVGLNLGDWKIQTYGISMVDYPYIGGFDAAGLVEDVGAEVITLAKGDQVLYQSGFGRPDAAFQQYSIVAAEIAAKIPPNLSFEQAASVPLDLNTVVLGLQPQPREAGQPAKPKSVGYPTPWEAGGTTKFAGKPALIVGGSSSVSQYAIQLARLSGFSPIITMSSLRHEEFLKSIGTTHVIDHTLALSAVQSEVLKLVGGKPIEFAFNSISAADTQTLAYDLLAPGGDLLLVNPEAITAEKKKDGNNKTVMSMFADVHTPATRDVLVALYSRLTEWLETGTIVPNHVEVIPGGLAGIPSRIERVKNNLVSGRKLVAHPQETL